MKYFRKSEFVKDPDKLHPLLMPLMDELRSLGGVPIHIHVAWDSSGHSKQSYHYKGMAVDFHFGKLQDQVLTPVQQFASIRSIPEFTGIGFYPWWNNPGWHLDLRGIDSQNHFAKTLFWLSPKKNTYLYNKEALLSHLLNL
ncbi:hypothetical protein MTBBW1_1140014 [Desulfamplus magnetovallimortis]|uniref:Peptidase M15A C-terminal domain-containing protein n=1 Tax=Desulfamplus magnetovallimortis TaxID=1246637 RepID=A0A1W1H5V6_9BACT|nr:DUF882 domain-containing protein [Desulfamplus magnetovallimortis]SLM27824.1 hypothetical protein MTBBW1_1140014 [Desulfamplus magnetovallimortis]